MAQHGNHPEPPYAGDELTLLSDYLSSLDSETLTHTSHMTEQRLSRYTLDEDVVPLLDELQAWVDENATWITDQAMDGCKNLDLANKTTLKDIKAACQSKLPIDFRKGITLVRSNSTSNGLSTTDFTLFVPVGTQQQGTIGIKNQSENMARLDVFYIAPNEKVLWTPGVVALLMQ
ncbi:hypothetical protein P152DRAFT_484456 [Eremomyces bilateralis CBS 781.70]|uniref:Uncharacterized protein n=1 Tax=Eremomyces bilateralis CBS 781.70 TaxID=1392243 RepID=A0A6G1FUZ7_9PEZI|nr:uncharacterized protein P152DRAFT_484456 [Eremomyces bilateralis CBS 781.70]KAF1809583.1 hypothetical protein P152DRAFT_484456 [Eremomyces bilateralis CBS 781.70]